MRRKNCLVYASMTFVFTGLSLIATHAESPVALSGLVTSAEEGPMEGVLVSAKGRQQHHGHGGQQPKV